MLHVLSNKLMVKKLDELMLLNDCPTKQHFMGRAYCNTIVDSLVEKSVSKIAWLGAKKQSKKDR